MRGATLRGLAAAVAALAIAASLAGCERMSGNTASLSTLAPVMARADGDPAGFEVDQVPHPQAVALNEEHATLVAMEVARRAPGSQ